MLSYGEIGIMDQNGCQVMGFFDWSLETKFEYSRSDKWRVIYPVSFKLLFNGYWITADIDKLKPVKAKLFKLVDNQLVLIFQSDLLLTQFITESGKNTLLNTSRELIWMN